MTLGRIIASLSRHRPTDVRQILEHCKFPLLHLGSGVYRDTYEIIGSGYVVKVPQRVDEKSHSITEFNAHHNILKSSEKYVALKPYMPYIPYFNRNTGVMLMRKYDTTTGARRLLRAEIRKARSLVFKINDAKSRYGGSGGDLHTGNWGVDEHGKLKAIDLGMFDSIGEKKNRKPE